jgi:hypothetical protein
MLSCCGLYEATRARTPPAGRQCYGNTQEMEARALICDTHTSTEEAKEQNDASFEMWTNLFESGLAHSL